MTLADGASAQVTVSASQRRFFGHPHVFSWGGGHRRINVEILVDGELYRWSGTDQQVVLAQRKNGIVYLVLSEYWLQQPPRESFEFVRWDGPGPDWQAIEPSEFPRDLAWQNLPYKSWHDISRTGDLWYFLDGNDNAGFDFDGFGRRHFPERWADVIRERELLEQRAAANNLP